MFCSLSYLEALVDARERGLIHYLPQAEEEDCSVVLVGCVYVGSERGDDTLWSSEVHKP